MVIYLNRLKLLTRKHPFIYNSFLNFRVSIKIGLIRKIYHWLSSGHTIRLVRIQKWYKKNQAHYLQVGGGHHAKTGKEWLNGDIIAGEIHLNATKNLPFPAESIDVVFTEQFIEHLNQKQAIQFLSEAYRVLKPGGIIRQSTPDLEKLIALYLDQNETVNFEDAVERHIRSHHKNTPYAKATGCQFINDMFNLWGHQFIYDKSTLQNITKNAGFVKIEWFSFGESEHDDLKNLERHADVEWMKNGLVMICEAKKRPTI